MTNFQMWSLIVGFFLPPVLSVIQQTKWRVAFRSALAFVACAVAGAGVAYFQGDLTGKRVIEAGLVVLVTTIATYEGFWKKTGISPAIESKTNAS